jgi:hypothetical protein
MTVGAGYCPSCSRTVYIGSGEEQVCPVCSTTLIAFDSENESRAKRIGENEARSRSINERIERRTSGSTGEFVCECGQENCGEVIVMPLQDYEAIRSHPTRFVIYPGHEMPEVEIVIEEADNHLVVRKRGEAGETARQSDPR